MRFDLRRVDQSTLQRHFAHIARQEGVEADEQALAIIARAADGSVRDGLSLLDQAIALGDGRVGEAHVTEMLGLADRTRIFELYDAAMRGSIVEALDIMSDLYAAGAEPTVVFRDLLELTHWLTRIKLVPDVAKDQSVPEAERVRGREMAGKLSLSLLSRTWQMLMKGLGEVEAASSSLQAADMVLIRLVYASDLPPPIDLVRRLSDHGPRTHREGDRVPSNASGLGSGAVPHAAARTEWATPTSNRSAGAALAAEPAPDEPAEERRGEETTAEPRSFEEVVSLAWQRREGVLAKQLSNDVHLVHFEPGRIEFRPTVDAPSDLAGRLARLLQECTGRRWMVSVSGQEGAPVLREQRHADEERLHKRVLEHPLVQAVLEAFPGAKVVDRRSAQEPTASSEATPDAGQAAWADVPTGDTIDPDNGGELP
jgi:DNA polymerase-3 subunit gamma/tau